jgi:hypothetical protein
MWNIDIHGRTPKKKKKDWHYNCISFTQITWTRLHQSNKLQKYQIFIYEKDQHSQRTLPIKIKKHEY